MKRKDLETPLEKMTLKQLSRGVSAWLNGGQTTEERDASVQKAVDEKLAKLAAKKAGKASQ